MSEEAQRLQNILTVHDTGVIDARFSWLARLNLTVQVMELTLIAQILKIYKKEMRRTLVVD